MYRTDIGVIGLAVMGRSIALNMADHGFKVGGYNRSRQVTERLIEEHPHENLVPFYELKELAVSYTHLLLGSAQCLGIYSCSELPSIQNFPYSFIVLTLSFV